MTSNIQPTPSPEQKKMGVSAGGIRQERSQPLRQPLPYKVDSIDIYEWYPGEFFLVHHADGKVGEDAIKSIEIMGYDPEPQCYFAPFFDSIGGSGTEEIPLDGDTWIWRGSNVIGVKEHRCFAVVSDDGKIVRARHEKSDDGQNWTLWMDVTLTKEN